MLAASGLSLVSVFNTGFSWMVWMDAIPGGKSLLPS